MFLVLLLWRSVIKLYTIFMLPEALLLDEDRPFSVLRRTSPYSDVTHKSRVNWCIKARRYLIGTGVTRVISDNQCMGNEVRLSE